MGNREDGRESWERREGRASLGESSGAARVPESKQGLVRLCRHHPSNRPNSSPEWNVVHKRQAHPAPGASLPRRSIPEGPPSVPPAGQGAWTPLSPETGRLDRWHPRLCFKGQGGTESSWEPPGGFWTVCLSVSREGRNAWEDEVEGGARKKALPIACQLCSPCFAL